MNLISFVTELNDSFGRSALEQTTEWLSKDPKAKAFLERITQTGYVLSEGEMGYFRYCVQTIANNADQPNWAKQAVRVVSPSKI